MVTVLKDERFTTERAKAQTSEQSAKIPWVPKVFKPLERNMLALDGADHTRLRGLVHKAFTPGLIEVMRMRIQSLTDELLDAVAGTGRMDLIGDYALPLPTTIIAEMLGVPAGDQHKFHRWSSALMATSTSTWGKLKAIPNIMAFMGYIRRLVKLREADPRDDLTSALVSARESGDRLSEDELQAMIFLLLIAGHETTVNLLGNGVLALLERPDQMARLRDDPELVKPAVEELLRYDSPVQMSSERYACEDVTIAGVKIAHGDMVFPILGSANRDERQFERPDELDITREPNRHLSLGQGVHYCLGAPLARMEGQIALNTLLRRLPELRLAVPRAAAAPAELGPARIGIAAAGVLGPARALGDDGGHRATIGRRSTTLKVTFLRRSQDWTQRSAPSACTERTHCADYQARLEWRPSADCARGRVALTSRNREEAVARGVAVESPPARGRLGECYEAVRRMTERSRARSPPRIARSSRCQTPARSNGIWRIRPGFSRRSCWRSRCSGYEPFHPSYGYLFNSYYNAVGDRIARPSAA